MNAKALARFMYARVPGLAPLRFTIKDFASTLVSKPEFEGVSRLRIRRGGLIIDVGAHRGQSISAFRRLQPSCHMVAFEPEPRSAARLAWRFRRDSQVRIDDHALGRESGSLTFFVPKYGRWDCDGMSATSKAEATQWLGDPGRMFRFDETKLTVHECAVKCATLDSFHLIPSLIKLHAQGAELDILKGAQVTLSMAKPALMCAFPTAELTNFVQQFDYQPYFHRYDGFAPGTARHGLTFTWFLTSEHLQQA